MIREWRGNASVSNRRASERIPELPPMAVDNNSAPNCVYRTIEAKVGVTTGVSAADRNKRS